MHMEKREKQEEHHKIKKKKRHAHIQNKKTIWREKHVMSLKKPCRMKKSCEEAEKKKIAQHKLNLHVRYQKKKEV